jgi:hypothetical protein
MTKEKLEQWECLNGARQVINAALEEGKISQTQADDIWAKILEKYEYQPIQRDDRDDSRCA